jgi:hypothetical protein
LKGTIRGQIAEWDAPVLPLAGTLADDLDQASTEEELVVFFDLLYEVLAEVEETRPPSFENSNSCGAVNPRNAGRIRPVPPSG